METITIKGLGYRELDVLGRLMSELGVFGRIGKTPLNPSIEIQYNDRTDTLYITDGERGVEIDLGDYASNNFKKQGE